MLLYTITQTAAIVGVTVRVLIEHRKKGYIPQPAYAEGQRKLYTESEVKLIKSHFDKRIADIRAENGLYSITQVAKLLGVSKSAITARIEKGLLTPPTERGSSRRYYYRPDELDMVKAAVNQYLPMGLPKPHDGFYSRVQAAKKLGIPHPTLQSWLDREEIDKPQHKMKTIPYLMYDDSDLRVIRQKKYLYFAQKLKQL